MKELAHDVHQISMMLRHGVNAYLLGDVLVDACGPSFGPRVVQELRHAQCTLAAHVVTQARGDHAGGSHAVVEETGAPVWAGARDVAALESGRVRVDGPLAAVIGALGNFTGVPVARVLREGDVVGPGFTVLETPGRTPGQIALWRADDGILICGDVWMNMSMLTTRSSLRSPRARFGLDVQGARAAQRRLAALAPRVVGFGHGPTLTEGAARRLQDWVAKHD